MGKRRNDTAVAEEDAMSSAGDPEEQQPFVDEDVFNVLSGSGDDSLALNLEDVEAPKFEVCPAGIYDCVVKDIQVQISKANNPMWVWQLEASDTPVGRRVFFMHHVLQKPNPDSGQMEWDLAGVGRIKEAALAVNPEFDLSGFNARSSMTELIGRPCRVKVQVGKYNGQDTNNVRQIMPPDEEGDFGIDSVV